jgi:hypothetical protein
MPPSAVSSETLERERGDIPGLLVKPAAVARENRLTG